MKRYWKLAVLCIVIAVSFSTYFIKLAFAYSQLPEFQIQKESGNESVLDSEMTIAGRLKENSTYDLQITPSGTSYTRSSLLDLITNSGKPSIIKQLIKKHRSFMRGKNNYVDSYYEDHYILAYAYEGSNGSLNPRQSFKLQVSVLNKKTNSVVNFTVPIQSNDDYINVEDVQRVGNQLEVVTDNGGKNQHSLHVYSVDLSKRKLINDRVVFSSRYSDARSYYAVEDRRYLHPNKNIVVFEEDSKSGKLLKLYKYSLESFIKKELKIPKNIPNNMEVKQLNDSTLYFVQSNHSNWRIMYYDIRGQKVRKSVTIDYPISGEENQQGSIVIRNNRAYVLSPYITKNHRAEVEVFDLQSGTCLFKGGITGQNWNGNGHSGKVELYLEDH